MLENASQHRIDIRMDEDAFYYWKLLNSKRETVVKSGSFEDKQECLDNLTHNIIKHNFWDIPIYDEEEALFLGTRKAKVILRVS